MKAQAFRAQFEKSNLAETQLNLLADHVETLERITNGHGRTQLFLNIWYVFRYREAYQNAASDARAAANHAITEQVGYLSVVIQKPALAPDVVQRVLMNVITQAYDAVAGVQADSGKLMAFTTWNEFLKSLPEKVPGVKHNLSDNKLSYVQPARIAPIPAARPPSVTVNAGMKPGVGMMRRN